MEQAGRARRWPVVAVVLLVLLVGAGLRLYRLPELPLGLHYDEAANGILAGEIAQGGWTPTFIRAYTGKEVLFFYWVSLWMRLAGRSVLALRLAAALAGLLTIAAAVWSTRELLHGRRDATWAAVLTGAFLATSFWHVLLSRYGFRAVMQPLFQALVVGSLWRGLRLATPCQTAETGRRRHRGWFWIGLSGLAFGLTAYTYLAARAFPLPILAALLVLLIADGRHRRIRFGQIALFLGVAGAALAPLAYFWLTNPGTFLNRAQQVAAATWGEVGEGLQAVLGMFFVRGDPYVRFNIPGRPLFGPAVAILFSIGLGVVVWRCVRFLRRKLSADGFPAEAQEGAHLRLAGYVFLLIVVPLMALPSALATGEVTPSNLRAVGMLPFVYVPAALGLLAVVSLVRRWVPKLANPWLWAAVVALALGSATAVAYFRDWASTAALYRATDGDLVDVADYLNQRNLVDGGPHYVASIHYRHPTLAFLARDYGNLRWLTGGRTVVFPSAVDGNVVIPRSAAGDLPWIEQALSGPKPLAQGVDPGGGVSFRAYRVPAGAWPEPSLSRQDRFGHIVELIGYDVIGDAHSGEQIDIAAWWRVLATPEHGDLGPVAHLTDEWGSVWGQTSPFHYPSEQWEVGEVFVDHLTIPLDPGAPPGEYAVRLGMFSPQAGSALPVLDADGRYAGTRVELPLPLDSAAGGMEVDADLEQVAGMLGVRDRLDATAGDLTLVGANLDTVSLRPGEPLRLALFWLGRSDELPDYGVELSVGDTTVYTGAPVHGTYPFPWWEAGQVVADRYDPRLPRHMAPGDYPLHLRLVDSDGQSAGLMDLDLGVVTVSPLERDLVPPPIPHPVSADFEGQVELLGYELSTDTAPPGETVRVTLFWRALTEMEENYTVFVHLVGLGGEIAGQHDGQPMGGSYPTSLWLSGEVVSDPHEVPIRLDAAPGDHWIEVGLYIAETGKRLVVTLTGDDVVRLQTFSVAVP